MLEFVIGTLGVLAVLAVAGMVEHKRLERVSRAIESRRPLRAAQPSIECKPAAATDAAFQPHDVLVPSRPEWTAEEQRAVIDYVNSLDHRSRRIRRSAA